MHACLFLFRILFCVVGLFFGDSSFNWVTAQNHQFRTYSFENGLSSYNAKKIVQDKFGFIWVATQEGINRFDGTTFLTIKKEPNKLKGLSENYVTDIALDHSGQMWVSTALGGIDELDPATQQVVRRLNARQDAKTGFISNWVRSLAVSIEDEMWVGTYYGLNVYNKLDRTFFKFQKNVFDPSLPLNVCHVGLDSLGHMWVAIEDRGVILFDTKSKKLVQSISKQELGLKDSDPFAVNSLFVRDSIAVYLCTNQGIKYMSYDSQSYKLMLPPDRGLSKIPNYSISDILEQSSGELWVGTNKGLYFRNKHTNFELHVHSDFHYNTLLDNNVRDLFEDSFGNVWISTMKGLNLLINGDYKFTSYNVKTGTLSEMDHVYNLYPISDSLIFACATNGLYIVNTVLKKAVRVLGDSDYTGIRSCIQVKKDQFLISSVHNLLVLEKDLNGYKVKIASLRYPELHRIQYNYFGTSLRYNDSLILLGSSEDEGLYKWNHRLHTLQQFTSDPKRSNSITEDNIHNLKKDRVGYVWILGNNSISSFEPLKNEFRSFHPKLAESRIQDPHFFFDFYDDGKFKWITTYGHGLLRFDTENKSFKAFNEEHGLSSNSLYCILPENDSVIWLSSNNGLTRFNHSAFTSTRYYSQDGLHSNAFDETSACKIGERLFFGGIDGFTEISENNGRKLHKPVPIYVATITNVNEQGRAIEISDLNPDSSVVNFERHQITFSIKRPDYENGQRSIISYKIYELNEDWVSLLNQSDVTLVGLSHGVYHFQARVTDAEGRNIDSAIITFAILPKWYETFGFKIVSLIFFILVIYSIYKYRLGLKQKQSKLRRDIASDLHDDIGSSINSVKIYAHLAEFSENKSSYLQQIHESVNDASVGIRDMIWVLDDQRNSIDELFNRIKHFALPLANASNIAIQFYSNDLNWKLKKNEKRNLMLIIKEAVNNIIKHSQCKNVQISLIKENWKITLIIKDDGCGFDIRGAVMGDGLKNIQERASRINCQANISSIINQGSTITVVKIRK